VLWRLSESGTSEIVFFLALHFAAFMSANVMPEPNVYTSIIDMGLIWHLTTPSIEDTEKGDGTKYTWSDFAETHAVSMIHMMRISQSRK